MEFNVGKVGINLGGYGIFLGDKGSLSVYINNKQNCYAESKCCKNINIIFILTKKMVCDV